MLALTLYASIDHIPQQTSTKIFQIDQNSAHLLLR
jgi:hypothetical protein